MNGIANGNPDRRGRLRWALSAALLLLVALAVVGGCTRTERAKPRPKPTPAPLIPQKTLDTNPKKILEQLAKSAHEKLDCVDCHGPKKEGTDKLGQASCKGCHEEEHAAYAASIHSVAGKPADKKGAACHDCHGSHDVLPGDNPESHTFSRRLPWTCGKCHENPDVAQKLGIQQPEAVQQYIESIHGKSLLAAGLLVAPSCVDCHGKEHRVFAAADPRSTVHPKNLAKTCGACHADAREEYAKSSHAAALAAGKALPGKAVIGASNQRQEQKSHDPDQRYAPTCQTCHTAHSIVGPGGGFRLESDRVCGHCHEDRLERYLETYHGRAHRLGDEDVAACHDCHGQHDIRPVSDPDSTLSEDNRLATCRNCHTNAPENFADYFAHADHTDRENYPGLYWAFMGMTGLLVGTFGFFGMHSIFWLIRSLLERRKNPAAFRAQKRKNRKEEGARLYQRFRPVDRFAHLLVIVSFLLLVITGMPLKFHEQPWAQAFFKAIGGPAAAGSLHRFGAIVTLGYFVIHIASWIGPIRRNLPRFRDENGKFRLKKFFKDFVFGPDSPWPRPQDAKDMWQNFKHFFGRAPKPKFETFTYWEKFDYIAVFWGVTVIGLSGLVLWFPATFTQVLPGWAINVAHIVHSDEALLAAGFIFTFHFFNSHFRPEKFPLDPVMFSGRVTEDEMRHEHAAQYERLKAEGRLEELAATDEWKDWKWVFNPFGAIAIVIGLVLAVFIFMALLGLP